MLKELFPYFDIDQPFLDQSQVQHQSTEALVELFSRSNPALCIIDLQKNYCDSNVSGSLSTEAIIKPITLLKEAFNRYDRPVYVVYMDGYQAGIGVANGGLYGIELDEEKDIQVPKDADSVFKASKWCGGINMSDSLEENGVDSLFFVGVHFSVCVEASATDSVGDYATYVVSDCTANGQTRGVVSPVHTVKHLSERGIKFVDGNQVSSALRIAHSHDGLVTNPDRDGFLPSASNS